MNKAAHKIKGENKTYEKLQNAVIQMYAEYDWKKIERVHAFQFACNREILKSRIKAETSTICLIRASERDQKNVDEICDLQVARRSSRFSQKSSKR